MKILNLVKYGVIGGLTFMVGLNVGMAFSEATAKAPVTVTQIEEVIKTERVEVPTEKVVTVEVVKVAPRVIETEITQAEKELIAKIVWSEAGYEDMIGKRLVVDTILNRVDDSNFPNTVYSVIYEKGQFQAPPISYTDECMEAVEMELYERLDYNILWFRSGEYHPYGIPAYRHGNHYFNWGEE